MTRIRHLYLKCFHIKQETVSVNDNFLAFKGNMKNNANMPEENTTTERPNVNFGRLSGVYLFLFPDKC